MDLEVLSRRYRDTVSSLDFPPVAARKALVRAWEHAVAKLLQESGAPDERAVRRLASFCDYFDLSDVELDENDWLTRLRKALS